MFNPEDTVNNSESTNLALCIFPHLKEFAVIDLREPNNENPIKIFNSNDILDENFFSFIEVEFKKMLKGDEFPFLNLIGLPQNIENLIRTQTLSSILDIIKTPNNVINDINNIAVLFFSGRILDISIQLNSLFAKPPQIDSPSETAKLLSPILNIPYHKLLNELKSKRHFVWIKRKLPPNQTKLVQKLDLNGIGFIEEFRRFYPNGNFAGQLLGFAGIDTQGLEGLENKYESLLAGKPTAYIVEKEGMFRTVPLSNIPKKIPDQYSLQLTIDSTIQHFAEKALREGVIKSRADRGAVVALHAKTGAILAMATFPGFDPNRYQHYSRAHHLNHAATVGYEPGSTFKMITIAAGLNEGQISPEQRPDPKDQRLFCN